MARSYHPHNVRDDEDPLPPQKKVNAHPASKVYAEGTGAGTGRPAIGMGWQNRNGTFSPTSGLGSPTGSLSQPLPRMGRKSGAAMLAERKDNFSRAVADGTAAGKIADFNANNTTLYMDAGGNIMPRTNGYDVPTDGKGGYMNPNKAPSDSKSPAPFNNISGQQQSMREAASPTPAGASARDISSAKGDWQAGSMNTRGMSGQYGAGASSITSPSAKAVSVANAVGSGSGMLQKIGSGVMAAMSRPGAPVLAAGGGAASFRSNNIAANQPTPATTPATAPPPKYNHSPEDLAKAKQWVNNVESYKAKEASAPPTSPMISGKLPSNTTAPSPFNKPAPSPATATVSNPGADLRALKEVAPSAAPAPSGIFANRAAANPGGIIDKVGQATGMLGNSIKTGISNAANAGANVASATKTLAAPLIGATTSAATAAGNALASGAMNRAAENPGGIAARLVNSAQANTTASTPPPAANPYAESAKQDVANDAVKEVTGTGGDGEDPAAKKPKEDEDV